MNDYKELITELEELLSLNDENLQSLIIENNDLQNGLADAADAIEQLVKERDEWMEYAKQERKRSIERSHELAVELDRVKKERDAAVADLKGLHNALEGRGLCCYACKNDVLDYSKSVCAGCALQDNWEWRGVQEEEHEAD